MRMPTPNIDLRHLRYFVAVAEQGNISKAAKRLHLSQPPLSRQIRDLEAEIGVALFRRESRQLLLTSAGELFLREVRTILQRFEDAVVLTRESARSGGDRIRIGHSSASSIEALPQILRCFQALHPQTEVELSRLNTSDLINSVRRGETDVSLTVCGSSTDLLEFRVEKLRTYGLLGAVSRQHPLADAEQIALAELAQQPVISLKRSASRWYNSHITDLLLAHNPRFEVAETHGGTEGVIAAVEAGRGVAVVYDVMAKTLGDRLALRPLTPTPPEVPLVLFYREDRQCSLIDGFVQAAQVLKRSSYASRNP